MIEWIIGALIANGLVDTVTNKWRKDDEKEIAKTLKETKDMVGEMIDKAFPIKERLQSYTDKLIEEDEKEHQKALKNLEETTKRMIKDLETRNSLALMESKRRHNYFNEEIISKNNKTLVSLKEINDETVYKNTEKWQKDVNELFASLEEIGIKYDEKTNKLIIKRA